MNQSKSMPQLVAGSRGKRSCDSGIAISATQPSVTMRAFAIHTGFHDASRLPWLSSVWIQSARTPIAVTANEYAMRLVCDGSIDTMKRSA